MNRGANQPTIRPAVAADEAFLLDLTRRLSAFPVPSWRTPEEIADADHAILREALHHPTPDSRILVAEVPASAPAGYIFLTTRSDYFTGARHAHIEVIAVAPDAVGRGIGRALMEAGERWARARGYRHITLNVFEKNEAARAVYDRLGYQPETIHYRKALDE